MKKLTALIVLTLILQSFATSQPCLPNGIYFSSQAQIDSFQINYPGCTEIEGDVSIHGGDITNLLGLNVLTSIGGNLWICYNDSLTNLNGLDNLMIVEGDLNFGDGDYTGNSSNPLLSDISGLYNLISIGGNFEIWQSSALTSLQGLNNLDTIGGNIRIELTPITDFSGLENLNTLGGGLWLWFNSLLTGFNGLNNLNSIGESLWLLQNSSLTSLSGLDNLTSINGNIQIGDNNPGHGNPVLTSLEGLDNISPGSIENLYIKGNSSLSECAVQSICDYLVAPGGTVEIQYNAPGCNSPVEVEEACESVDVSDFRLDPEISIIPNPATDKITINSKSEVQLKSMRIFNQLGQEVSLKDKTFENFDVSILDQGIYIVVLEFDELKVRKKLIIN